MSKNEHPPQNVNELCDRLKRLDVDVSTSTLQRWAKQDLIPKPDPPRGKGRGKGSVSVWPERAIRAAAGVWMIRGSYLESHWSRRILSKEYVKNVQHVAAKMYRRPIVLLSLPDDTLDEDDPPLETVTFALDCPQNVQPSLFSYLIATEKALHNWPLAKAAVVSFEWAESVRGRYTAEERRRMPKTAGRFADSRELLYVSVDEAPHGKDELRFLVGGKDVREHLLESRRLHRKLSSKYGEQFELAAGGVPKGMLWPLASNPTHIEERTWEDVTQKYKKGELSEREYWSRLRLAYCRELAKERGEPFPFA